jgi:hypothetical protein
VLHLIWPGRSSGPLSDNHVTGAFEKPVVNFVIRSKYLANEANRCRNFDEYVVLNRSFLDSITAQADMHWCALSYIRLRDHGMPGLKLSDTIDPTCINVVHSAQARSIQLQDQAFVVCIKADMDRRSWAHYHIVQNLDQLATQTSCIYLWSQPGLIGRIAPPDSIRVVGYVGQPYNGNLAQHPDELGRFLQTNGFEFQVPYPDWYDLSHLDVIVGIRSFDQRRHSAKPPSKLLNAWKAGIPFIGGADSAYSQCGTNGVDYLVATSRHELIAQLCRLRDDPDLRASLIRNGRAAAARYDDAALAEQWRAVLEGPVAERYRSWHANPAFEGRRHRWLALQDNVVSSVRTVGAKMRNTIFNAKFK